MAKHIILGFNKATGQEGLIYLGNDGAAAEAARLADTAYPRHEIIRHAHGHFKNNPNFQETEGQETGDSGQETAAEAALAEAKAALSAATVNQVNPVTPVTTVPEETAPDPALAPAPDPAPAPAPDPTPAPTPEKPTKPTKPKAS